ncbi:MAG: hypothetical protein D6746_07540 [Bacteroidetes bacterium]|nr:MAG: hypothetical protein D6746_07540 [Bacteroidota bacterium]
MPLTVCLDIDGVLADLMGAWQEHYRFAFDADWSHDGSWDLHKGTCFPSTSHVFDYLSTVPGFWETLPLYPGVQGGVWHLLNAGHQVYLATNRTSARLQNATTEWVKSWWPARQQPRIEFVSSTKAHLPGQVMLEDNPVRINDLVITQWPVPVVMDRPWNRDVLPDERLMRVKNFMAEFVDLVDMVDVALSEDRDPLAAVRVFYGTKRDEKKGEGSDG